RPRPPTVHHVHHVIGPEMHPQAVPVAVEKIGKGQQGEPKFAPGAAARTLLAFRCFCCHAAILTDAAHLPLAISCPAAGTWAGLYRFRLMQPQLQSEPRPRCPTGPERLSE